METNYKELPFNLETAKQHPEWVWTVDGLKARLICDNILGADGFNYAYAFAYDSRKSEGIGLYDKDGISRSLNGNDDLVLRKPITKRKAWAISHESINSGERELLPIPLDTLEEAQTFVREHNEDWEEGTEGHLYETQFHEIEIEE